MQLTRHLDTSGLMSLMRRFFADITQHCSRCISGWAVAALLNGYILTQFCSPVKDKAQSYFKPAEYLLFKQPRLSAWYGGSIKLFFLPAELYVDI